MGMSFEIHICRICGETRPRYGVFTPWPNGRHRPVHECCCTCQFRDDIIRDVFRVLIHVIPILRIQETFNPSWLCHKACGCQGKERGHCLAPFFLFRNARQEPERRKTATGMSRLPICERKWSGDGLTEYVAFILRIGIIPLVAECPDPKPLAPEDVERFDF